jgi:methionyl-tRNA formyltransferase
MAKIAYFGTGEFAVAPLRAVRDHVQLVVTQPDRPSGRGMKMQASPVKVSALEMGIDVHTPEKARAKEFVEFIQSLCLDYMLVASYGQILSEKLLSSARNGGINLHGSILPKYRGAAPIQRAIMSGDTETGVSLMQMDRGMDTGDIIEIETTPIAPDETYRELQLRLSQIAADQALRWVDRLAGGEYPRQPQDHASATYAAKIDRDETELSFRRTASEEYNRFRGVTPNPGAGIVTNIGRIRLGSVRLARAAGAPGEVLNLNPLTIAFQEGSLEWHEIQPEGKKRMSGRDFANGARIQLGTRLTVS